MKTHVSTRTSILSMGALALAVGCSVSNVIGAEAEGANASEALQPAGYVLVLPGVWNTRLLLDRFVEAARARHPEFEVVVRPWGVPLLSLYNLWAYERNLETAAEIAQTIRI